MNQKKYKVYDRKLKRYTKRVINDGNGELFILDKNDNVFNITKEDGRYSFEYEQEFLIVYESTWNNKFTMKSKIGRLGDDISRLLSMYMTGRYSIDFDKDKLNSDNPYDIGATGFGFYDINVNVPFDENDENCDLAEYGGVVMIFTI